MDFLGPHLFDRVTPDMDIKADRFSAPFVLRLREAMLAVWKDSNFHP